MNSRCSCYVLKINLTVIIYLMQQNLTKGMKEMNHYQIWHAIDLLAHAYGLSCSGLAKVSGLDPTTFNKSKRSTRYKQPRWPSTYSISKVLAATGASIQDFCKLIADGADDTSKKPA